MISPPDLVAVLAVGWLVAVGRRLHGWRVAGLLVGLIVIASFALPDQRGFRARYYANTSFQDPFEPSTEYRAAGFTRVDRRIDFTPGAAELPLAWVNDLARFNYYGADVPQRDALPFAVVWEGYWWVETHGDVLGLYMDAPGATGEIQLDGVKVLAMGPNDVSAAASVEPLRGWHQLVIRVSAPPTATKRVSAGQLINNHRFPFDAASVARSRIPAWQRTSSRVLDISVRIARDSVFIWLGVLVLLALRDIRRDFFAAGSQAETRRAVVKVLSLVAIAEAIRFAWPWAGQLMILPGGDDSLTYEFYARHIQMDGILMPHLQEPFYYQVLYPYFVAALHALFGESMFGPMLAQRLLVAVVAWAVMDIAVRISREDVWRVALGAGVVFAYAKVAPISAKLLNESLFVPLLVVWTLALLRLGPSPTPGGVVRAGLLGGVTALTRTPALLAVAAALPACWSAGRRSSRRIRYSVTFVACVLAVVSLISIRNWIVVHAFVPVPGEFAVTFLGGNQPPPDVSLDLTTRAPLYDRLGVHEFTRQVLEYAIAAPGAFAANIARKALFACGYYESYAPGWGISVVYLTVSIAGAIGIVLTLQRRSVPVAVAIVPALIALSQFAAVVLVYPKGERLILPFHAILAPYAAVAIDRLLYGPRIETAGD